MLGFEKLATRKGKETLAMKKDLQVIAGTIAGLAVVFCLVIAVEIFSNWVHPLPPESEYSMEIMCAHVAAYPHWVLAAVVPMWGATAFAGVWVAGSIGRWIASAIVAVLLLAALAFNVSMLPYTLWFKGVMPMAAIASLALGAWVACKGQSAAAFRIMW
jgi:hypothetical protein